MALFSELNSKHVKMFERFLIKLNNLQTLKKLFENNELSKKKIMMFALDIANYTNQHVRAIKVNKYIVRPMMPQGQPSEAQNHANQPAGASVGGEALNPGFLRTQSQQERNPDNNDQRQPQANVENQNDREVANAANPNTQVLNNGMGVANEVQNTGNTGHTGHSDF